MFEDYYFDDPALQDALAAAGYYTDPARAPAVMPSTVQAAEPIMGIGSPAAAATAAAAPIAGIGSPAVAAPYDISGLNLSGLGGFGGGRMGGVIQDPNIQYITAPVSNKGNPTGRMGGNVFAVTPDQPVRLVDLNTKTVVFEGTGYDAAREATRLGQSITDARGRKASYDIQTADPSGVYTTVANEKRNKTFLGDVAEIAGTLAPIAASFIIPGLGLTTLGAIGASAGVGGLGAALKGDNILKGAALGGLGAAGGAYLGPAFEAGGQFGTQLAPRLATAIGTGLGSTAGGLVTGQNLKNSLLGGVASGAMSYLSPDITKSLGIGGTPSARAANSGDGGGSSGDVINVLGSPAFSPGLTLGGSQNKIQRALSEAPYNGLTVTGNGIGSGFGFNFGGNQFGAPGAGTSALDRLTEAEMDQEEIDVLGNKIIRAAPVSVPITGDIRAGLEEFEKNPIVAEGSKLEQSTGNVNLSPLDLAVLDRLSGMENDLATDDIVVTGNKAVPIPVNLDPGFATVSDTLPLPKMDPSLTEKSLLEKIKDAANLANAVSVLVPLAGGVLGGGGGGGTLAPDTSGLNFTTNPLRPTTPGTGIGGIGGRYPYTPTTYGRAGGDQETEYMFFTRDPVTGAVTAAPAPATTRVAPAAISSGIGQQAPTAITAAQPNSARYEAAAVNPTELSQKLLDRAAQVEAINQRYKSQYGLQDSDIDAMFQGTYGLNMADSANSPNFEAARLISSPYRSELENIYGDLPTMRYALSSPVNALGRTRDSLSQLEAARNRAQQSLVDSSSPEWEQQYLAYMTGATEQMPLAPIGNTPEEWTRRMEIVRGYGPDIAYDTIKNWNDTRSADPARFAAERADYESVRNDATGTYNYALADLNRGAGIQSATAPVANEPAGPAGYLPSDNTFAEGGEIDDDMVKHLVDYHKNGGHQGPGQVKGIGSGQEDKIPAYLSDGEYVWSAQDVADLGDGSTDEGVRRLDKMRQMVRRQAGRKDVKKIAKPQKGIDKMLKAVGGMV